MTTANFYRAIAIRQQARAGATSATLAHRFGLPEVVIEKVLAARVRESAAKVLDDMDTPGVVKRFVLVEGRMVDFTGFITE